jgi:hypothetical protein
LEIANLGKVRTGEIEASTSLIVETQHQVICDFAVDKDNLWE